MAERAKEKGLNILRLCCRVSFLDDRSRRIYGKINIRHQLTDKLKQLVDTLVMILGPTKRGLGYGKNILRLALKEAKKIERIKFY
jgi:predicted acetyltransferase